MINPNDDPFDVPASAPSLSFKDARIGFSYSGKVVKLPELIQARDYETGGLAYWPDENPKMTVVLHLEVDGEVRSLWAPKPSSMFAAIAAAQTENGTRMKLGDTLTVTFTGERANEKNPRLNPAKQYKVAIEPADVFSAPAEVQPSSSNGHSAAASAPAVSRPAPAIDPAAAAALLPQIQGLIALGLSDEQIRAAVPQATQDVLAAVRAIPVG